MYQIFYYHATYFFLPVQEAYLLAVGLIHFTFKQYLGKLDNPQTMYFY